MRKVLFITSMLLIGLSITFISCEKSTSDSVSSDSQSQQLQKDQAVTDRILRFQDVIINTKLNPEYKSDETQPVEEVLWDIEASLNYTYGFVNEPTNLTRAKESALEFELTATDQMTEQESVQLYDDILAQVRNLYDEIDNDEKYIKSIDMELKSTPNKSSENEIRVNVMIGTQVTEEETPYTDWIYGESAGTCEFDPNTIGEDAATELTRVISQTYPNYEEGDETEDGCRIYYTDQTTMIVEPLDRPNNDDDVLDNVEDYRLFYATSELTSTGDIEEAECILKEQMEFYDDHIRLMIQQIPHNYDRMWFSVDDHKEEVNNTETIIYHELTETIGLRHIDTQSCYYPIDPHDDL